MTTKHKILKEHFDCIGHEEVFHLIQYVVKLKYKEKLYIIKTTTSGNDFAVQFQEGDMEAEYADAQWRDMNEDDPIEQRIFEMLDDGDIGVKDSWARYGRD
jgi:hypothetical protein